MAEIARAEFEAFRTDTFSRLDRMESKLDESIRCNFQKMPRAECDEHRAGVWSRITKLERYFYIGVGMILAVEAIVIPIILTVVKGG